MDKKKIETIAIPILILIFVVYFGDMLRKLGVFGGKRPAPVTAAAQQATAGIGASKIVAFEKKKMQIENLQWIRDPFVPYEVMVREASSVENLHLMGITWSSDSKSCCAIINDEIVNAGSAIGSFNGKAIKKDMVIVKDEKGIEHELSIKEEF